MADIVSKEMRSKMMGAVKSVSRLENMVASELWKRGVRFRRNTTKLMGRPDISIKKFKIVIFIDSCFWHACPLHGVMPKTNTAFWEGKLQANKARDNEVDIHYRSAGWNICRVWEHDLKKDFAQSVDAIYGFIDDCKNRRKEVRHIEGRIGSESFPSI